MRKAETNNKPEKNEIFPKKAVQEIKLKRLDKKNKKSVERKSKISQLIRSKTDKISTNFLLPFSELLHDHSFNKSIKEEKEKENYLKEDLKNIANKTFENNNEVNDYKDGKKKIF